MRRQQLYIALIAVFILLSSFGAAVPIFKSNNILNILKKESNTMSGFGRHALIAAFGWSAPASMSVGQQPQSLPASLGINLAEVRYYASTAPFANLAIGSEWNDSHWKKLSNEHVDLNDNILSLPADGVATRFLLMPPTGPKGFEVSCTFSGSGTISVEGVAGTKEVGNHTLRFRMINEHGKQPFLWLVVKNVDPKKPLRDLDCRDARLDRAVRFRPEFLETLRGYRVIRFMDWQNANANEAVSWNERHTPASIRLDRDGVSIEDMMALTRELNADPWLVIPWNANDEYVTKLAQMVRAQLPASRSVYVEVGNEVWNNGFSVGKQAVKEGMARKLGQNEHEAGMRRYAERTTEVMSRWEAIFAGRKGLVRVLATQHVWPETAQIALSFRDTAKHIDALATAPYFGAVLGGYDNTRDSSLQKLNSEMVATIKLIGENRSIANSYKKRYIGYEGGQGLVLPAQIPLSTQIQHDPAMYDIYRRYLAAWQRDAGDVLCLFNSVYRPTSWGSWGLAEWEDETPAEAPKLRAVREFMHAADARRAPTG